MKSPFSHGFPHGFPHEITMFLRFSHPTSQLRRPTRSGHQQGYGDHLCVQASSGLDQLLWPIVDALEEAGDAAGKSESKMDDN